MEMDSVIAAANPAARSTVFDPPPAITPRMMPRMLTRPSWPPRMTSRSQFVLRWPSRWRDGVAAAIATVARTVRPNRVSAPSRRSRWAFIARLPSLLAPDQAASGAEPSRLGSIANGEQLLGVGAGPATGAHPFGKQTGR